MGSAHGSLVPSPDETRLAGGDVRIVGQTGLSLSARNDQVDELVGRGGQKFRFIVRSKPYPDRSYWKANDWDRGGKAGVSPTGGRPDSDSAPRVGRVATIPRAGRLEDRFELLQKWEGQVESVSREQFVARLFDLTDPSRPVEVASFDVAELAAEDRPLLTPGAVFYWSMGYQVERSGQKMRVSFLRFRRLPSWTKEELSALGKVSPRIEAFFRNGSRG